MNCCVETINKETETIAAENYKITAAYDSLDDSYPVTVLRMI